MLGFFIAIFILGCSNTPEIHDLKEFCDYTLECYKNNEKSKAIALRITKEEALAVINSAKLSTKTKEEVLKMQKKREEEGFFDTDVLGRRFDKFRSQRREHFWKNFTVENYESMETIRSFGNYEMAEPIIWLKEGEDTPIFKPGELIKTQKGWRILRGPFWR